MNFLIRWFTTSIAVAAAVLIVPGIEVTAHPAWVTILIVGAVLGFISATIGQLVKIGSMGCIVLTLGLLNLVINAFLLWASAWVSQALFDAAFVVNGFWPAFWGGIVVSLTSMLLGLFLPYDKERL